MSDHDRRLRKIAAGTVLGQARSGRGVHRVRVVVWRTRTARSHRTCSSSFQRCRWLAQGRAVRFCTLR